MFLRTLPDFPANSSLNHLKFIYMYKRTRYYVHKTCSISSSPTDIPVNPNLAYTPAQMHEMMLNGVPISTQAIGLSYDEGTLTPPDRTPLEFSRGIDRADAWQEEKNIKSKVYKAHKKDVADHGVTPINE